MIEKSQEELRKIYKKGNHIIVNKALVLNSKYCCRCGTKLSIEEQGYIVCDSCFMIIDERQNK